MPFHNGEQFPLPPRTMTFCMGELGTDGTSPQIRAFMGPESDDCSGQSGQTNRFESDAGAGIKFGASKAGSSDFRRPETDRSRSHLDLLSALLARATAGPAVRSRMQCRIAAIAGPPSLRFRIRSI